MARLKGGSPVCLRKIKILYLIILLELPVNIPLTVRTRAGGGWSGKSLYINTPGIKIG